MSDDRFDDPKLDNEADAVLGRFICRTDRIVGIKSCGVPSQDANYYWLLPGFLLFFFHFKVFDLASNYRPHLSNVSLFFFVDWFLFFPQESRDGAPVLIRNSREVLIDFILISRRRSSFLIQVEIFVFVVHLGGSFEGFESCF